jgi:hypothetical protein
MTLVISMDVGKMRALKVSKTVCSYNSLLKAQKRTRLASSPLSLELDALQMRYHQSCEVQTRLWRCKQVHPSTKGTTTMLNEYMTRLTVLLGGYTLLHLA